VSVAPPNLAELVRELHNDNAKNDGADVKSGWSATLNVGVRRRMACLLHVPCMLLMSCAGACCEQRNCARKALCSSSATSPMTDLGPRARYAARKATSVSITRHLLPAKDLTIAVTAGCPSWKPCDSHTVRRVVTAGVYTIAGPVNFSNASGVASSPPFNVTVAATLDPGFAGSATRKTPAWPGKHHTSLSNEWQAEGRCQRVDADGATAQCLFQRGASRRESVSFI
jgi:hypothetical protein